MDCIIDDLRAAGQNIGGKREYFEAELKQVEEKVVEDTRGLPEHSISFNILYSIRLSAA